MLDYQQFLIIIG